MSIFIYRRTNPIVHTGLRIILTVVRALALLFLLLIIFETTLSFLFEKNNPPVLAVAIDNSASMTITDPNGSRSEMVSTILNNDVQNVLNKKFDVKYYALANGLVPFDPQRGDTLNFLGDVTNIRQGLEKIKADNLTENLTNILLISDGSYNDGGNPVRYAAELGVPVHTIAIGSDEPVRDLVVTNVDANPFTYAEQTTPVQITIRNSGFDKITVPIELKQDNITLARQMIDLPPSPSEHTVRLEYTPKTIGRQKLSVVVQNQAGERIFENNSRSFYVDVFKSKLQMLLCAGSVSPDVAFIKNILQNDRYEVQSLVHKNNGQFYEKQPSPAELANIDIFIFLDFPMRGVSQAFLQNLLSTLTAKKQPVLIIPGYNTSLADLNRFADFIPLQTASILPAGQQISAQLSPLGATHPVMQVTTDPLSSQSIWRELPPVFAPLVVRNLAPGSEVLAYARLDQQQRLVAPLVAIRTNGAHKSAAIFATQLWRWDFMMHGINRTDDVYSHLLDNMIRWLETNRSESLVRVSMEKTQYSYGDPIDMKIDIFDENLNSVDDADVHITLQRDGASQDFSAQAQGDGIYSAFLQAPQPGDYKAGVSATLNGIRLGEETVLFSVGEYSAELTDIQAQPTVLQSLSNATGGQFAVADSSAWLFNVMHGEKTVTPISMENELWNNKIILVLILFLLTLEWFIRKRRGMV